MSDVSLDDETRERIRQFREDVDANPSLSSKITDNLFGDGIDLGQLAQECGYDLSNEDFLAWIDHMSANESVELHDFELALVAGGGMENNNLDEPNCNIDRHGMNCEKH